MVMCDYCWEQYHPNCINITESEDEIRQMTLFQCPACMTTGQSIALYDPEGIYIYDKIMHAVQMEFYHVL